jgi:adenosine deaminase
MTDLHHFIDGLPKVELHLHIEGSLEPEMLFALAKRNGVAIPFASADAVRAAYDFGNLQDFLDIYYQGMNVLRTEQDFYDLTMAYLTRVAAENVLHTEIFFDPQGHTERGVSFETALDGITRALDDGQKQFGITNRLILCFLRHLSEESAFETLRQALPHKGRIYGVGLDSSELGNPPGKFQRVFHEAKKEGFHLVAHAGEEGPAAYIHEALDLLHVERIDHGNRCLDDSELVNRLVAEQMALTVCPLSNLKLRVVRDMKRHPLKKMLNENLLATVNSDDPAYFGGYMNDNYKAVADGLGLDRMDILALAYNAAEASFADPARKEELNQALRDYEASA